jgi:uncharacterized protein YqfA (UPF0365 family)
MAEAALELAATRKLALELQTQAVVEAEAETPLELAESLKAAKVDQVLLLHGILALKEQQAEK